MKRKKFIFISGLSAISVFLPLESCQSDHDDLDLEVPHSLTKIVDWEEIELIGKEYIERFPNEADVQVLKKEILIDIKNQSSPESSKDIESTLRNRVLNEFKLDDFLILHGWMISVTEARQCALFYLNENS